MRREEEEISSLQERNYGDKEMSAKENKKNSGNTQNTGGMQKKKLLGRNVNLHGKTFELTSSRDCVHQ